MVSSEESAASWQRVSQPPSNPRMLWMDILRGAAILAVISFHSVTILDKYDFEANIIWQYLNETLKLFRMPTLIFLSGMLLQKSLAKPTPEYFWGKVRGILWPFLIWSTAYAVVTEVDFTSFNDLIFIYKGGSHLWFLAFIFLYYISAKPLNSIHPLAISAAAFCLSLMSPDGEKYSERILYLMSLFFLGSYSSRYADPIRKILTSPLIWLLLPIVIGSVLITIRYNLDFGPKWLLLSLAGIIFFSAVAHRLEKLEISQPLIWIGQRSIVFYVSHAIFIILVAKLLGRLGITNYAAAAVISIVVSLIGGWVLAILMVRWALVGWLFTFPPLRQQLQARRGGAAPP